MFESSLHYVQNIPNIRVENSRGAVMWWGFYMVKQIQEKHESRLWIAKEELWNWCWPFPWPYLFSSGKSIENSSSESRLDEQEVFDSGAASATTNSAADAAVSAMYRSTRFGIRISQAAASNSNHSSEFLNLRKSNLPKKILRKNYCSLEKRRTLWNRIVGERIRRWNEWTKRNWI